MPETSPSDILLEAHNIRRRFGSEWVIDDVSLSVQRGQSIAVVSPSGTGKSTLLSILGLLLDKTEGTLIIAGKNVDTLSAQERAAIRRCGQGFIFQYTHLIGSLRALDNVLVPSRLLQRADKTLLDVFTLETRARSLLDSFGLENRLYHYPHQLSVGQRRRVAVARALLCDPPLIFADEPTNDLDSESARLVSEALFGRLVDGAALVIATHDPALIQRADTVVDLTR